MTSPVSISTTITGSDHGITTELLKAVSKYCKQRNLDEDSYWEGILTNGPLTTTMNVTLIRYHKEWLK